jgi:hypothetical protein
VRKQRSDPYPFTIRPLSQDDGGGFVIATLKARVDRICQRQWRQRAPKSLHMRLVRRAEQEGVSLNTLVTSMIAEGFGIREPSSRRR